MDNQPNRNPIRVLFLTGCTGRGGAGHSLYYLLKYIDRRIIEPLVVMPTSGIIGKKLRERGIRQIVQPRLKERFYEMRFKKTNLITVPLSILLNLYDSFVFAIILLPKIIAAEKIDLIYSNHMMVKIIGIITGLIMRRPVILHCRTIYSNRLERLLYLAFAALPHVKKIVTVSKAAALNYRRLRHKVVVVPNGVDLEEHNPDNVTAELRSDFDIPEDKSVIGFIGRIVKWKGIDVFMQVAKKLLVKRDDLVFVVIGGVPNGTISQYQSRIQEQDDSGSILFTGFQEDIRPYLKDLDIVVVPSISPDPCPRSVIEAMSFGIPIVGSSVGGISETIQHERTGLLARPGNVADFTAQLLTLLDNEELPKQIGKNARAAIKDEFCAKKVAHRIQELIVTVHESP